jgi:hypothetical protein
MISPRVYPDYRFLYVIVLGILAGIAIGPLLHVVNPDLYDRLFVGAGEIDRLIQKNNAEMNEKRAILKASGASDAALDEFNRQNEPGEMLLKAKAGDAQLKHYLAMLGRTTALTIAVIFLMVIETLVDPQNDRVRGRLTFARYVLVAGWLALVIAQARMLESFPLFFFATLVGVCILFALFPYTPTVKATAATPPAEPEPKP